jgi:uncharacterized protein
MNTSIQHIPDHKRADLEKVIDIIKTTVYKDIEAEMIILYWSYARGDFVVRDVVREWWNTRVYESDFDILVITKKPTQEKNLRLAQEIEKKIASDSMIESHFSIIIEDIYHVNKMLKESRYFYMDIKREWVILHDTKKYQLASSEEIPKERKTQIQQEDFDLWFLDANRFFGHYKFDVENTDYKIGAFQMHQAAERYMTAYLLVKTWYKPKTHDLEVLYTKISVLNDELKNVFNLSDTQEKYHFELLRKAYIEARYSKEYSITAEELAFLDGKMITLRNIVERLCTIEIEN